jgi:hypothetical protein
VLDITVGGSHPYNNINTPFVSVTICGASKCETIDNIILDTGSDGLRILSSALKGLQLKQETIQGDQLLGECSFFGSGYTWGGIYSAEVKLTPDKYPKSGHTLGSLPIQIIDQTFPDDISSYCGNRAIKDNKLNTASTLYGNGILGVGNRVADGGTYFACSNNGCSEKTTSVPLEKQVKNPVAMLKSDNNGVIVSLPANSNGNAKKTGKLTLGIGTQSNNKLEGEVFLPFLDQSSREFQIKIPGLPSITRGFLDSGTNFFGFNGGDMTKPSGSDFYCPAGTKNFLPTTWGGKDIDPPNVGQFSVACKNEGENNLIFDKLGGPSSRNNLITFGLPFFFGRDVFTAIGEKTPSCSVGYVAFREPVKLLTN